MCSLFHKQQAGDLETLYDEANDNQNEKKKDKIFNSLRYKIIIE